MPDRFDLEVGQERSLYIRFIQKKTVRITFCYMAKELPEGGGNLPVAVLKQKLTHNYDEGDKQWMIDTVQWVRKGLTPT